ncbi:PIN domain-containing protein [Streptomyces sp. NPDC012421]|uniref:PIN domain-containing protein n=1 Tax=Streptomyces sp. NPDC012421 TaxID=3364832 RepID=UPI0036EAF2F0
MIILDTNAVNGLDPHGSRADLIRMLRKADLSISVPWVVREELTAHKLHEYQRSFDKMRRGHRELTSLEPNLAGRPPKFEGEKFAKFWREQYSQVFDTIPTDHSALQASVLREAACLKPAKADASNKAGGRDVAVWFSILDYMDKNPGEHVYFVTNNTKDFGTPEEWPFPLDLDLEGKSDRITQLLNFEEVLKEFTSEEEASEEVNASLLKRLSDVQANSIMAREAWEELWGQHRLNRKTRPDSTLKVELDAIAPAQCRRIGESVWYWTKATWHVYMHVRGASQPMIAAWDTSILFPGDPEAPISLLRSGIFTRLSVADLSEEMQRNLAEDINALESDIRDTLESPQDSTSLISRNNLPAIHNPHPQAAKNALQYARSVARAFTNIGYEVVHADSPMDHGFDLKVNTPDGIIAVVLKYGRTARWSEAMRLAAEVPQEAGDAILIVADWQVPRDTKRYLRMVERGDTRPISTMTWTGPWDTPELESRVHMLVTLME